MRRAWTLLLVVLLSACSGEEPDYPRRATPQGLFEDVHVVLAGQELFRQHCAFCHGHLNEGRSLRANDYDPMPMDFADLRYRDIDPAYLYWRIEQGKNVEPFRSRGSVMPAWGVYFSEEQIWQLAIYLKSRAH